MLRAHTKVHGRAWPHNFVRFWFVPFLLICFPVAKARFQKTGTLSLRASFQIVCECFVNQQGRGKSLVYIILVYEQRFLQCMEQYYKSIQKYTRLSFGASLLFCILQVKLVSSCFAKRILTPGLRQIVVFQQRTEAAIICVGIQHEKVPTVFENISYISLMFDFCLLL